MNAREEIEKTLALLRAKADTLEAIRATVEISAWARQAHLPEMEPSLIPEYARATLLAAFIQYDLQHMGKP